MTGIWYGVAAYSLWGLLTLYWRLFPHVPATQVLAHRIVWVNPHRGKSGYAPLAGGMAAALPYVDDFVAGHTLATLEKLAELLSREERHA